VGVVPPKGDLRKKGKRDTERGEKNHERKEKLDWGGRMYYMNLSHRASSAENGRLGR